MKKEGRRGDRDERACVGDRQQKKKTDKGESGELMDESRKGDSGHRNKTSRSSASVKKETNRESPLKGGRGRYGSRGW